MHEEQWPPRPRAGESIELDSGLVIRLNEVEEDGDGGLVVRDATILSFNVGLRSEEHA